VFENILKTIAGAMSGEELLRLTETIWRSDHEFTFPAFERTQRQIAALYAEAGVKAEILEVPADGETSFGDLTMPLAWDCRSAVLELVEPAERRCVLADRSQDPLATVMWCGPTPPEGIEAELLRAGNAPLTLPSPQGGEGGVRGGAHGRIVYTPENPHNLKAEALRQGALGIVSSYGKNAEFAPDARFWVNAWSDPPDEWPYRKNDQPLPAMLITPRQGRDLEALLDKGPVRVRMQVDSRLYAGTIAMASGLLEGETDEEVLVLGHAMEQGANDNASGCACIVESIRCLARLVRAGTLPKPKRSIRGLTVNECYGTAAYIALRRQTIRRTVAALNLDTVGRHREELAAIIKNTGNPDSFPAFTDALMDRLLAKHLQRVLPHCPVQATAWCAIDNFMNDPVTGVPATTLHSADRWWHCGADTMEKIDPRTLSAIGAISATYLYFLANAGAAEAQWLGAESLARWDERLAREAAKWWERLSAAPLTLPSPQGGEGGVRGARPVVLRDALARLDFLSVVGGRTALAPLRLVPAAERKAVRPVFSQLARHARRRAELEKRRLVAQASCLPAVPAPLPAIPAAFRGLTPISGCLEIGCLSPKSDRQDAGPTAPDAEHLVPLRKFRGMLCYDTIPRERREGKSSPMWNAALMRALMWADGRRSLAEVLRLGALDSDLPQQGLLDEILFLSRNGLIEWKRK